MMMRRDHMTFGCGVSAGLLIILALTPAFVCAESSGNAARPQVMDLAGFLDSFMEGLNKGVAKGIPPTLSALSPSRVGEAEPFTLRLTGTGFDTASSVFIQVRDPDSGHLTWRKFVPQFVDEQTLNLTFDRGFSANPAQRNIYVTSSTGKQSQQMMLVIGPGSSGGASVGASPSGGSGDSATASTGSISIQGIDPAEIQEAVPFVLTLSGRGFTADSQIYVEVNKNAHLEDAEPEYDFIAFTPQFIDEGELQLEFDNGFSSNPSQRKIYVEGASGNRSNEIVLTIQP